MNIMRTVNDRQPTTVLCSTEKHQNYCVLQTALQRGHTVDCEKRSNVGGDSVGPEAVNAAM